MSKMIEVKVADLIGPALDWAVGSALGWVCYPEDSIECGNTWHMGGDRAPFGPVIRTTDWRPSTDWAQAGTLIKKYGVLLSPPSSLVHRNFGSFDKRNGYYESGLWSTTIFGKERKHRRTSFSHETEPLIPVMRAIVQFELGDVVSVPAELMQGGAE